MSFDIAPNGSPVSSSSDGDIGDSEKKKAIKKLERETRELGAPFDPYADTADIDGYLADLEKMKEELLEKQKKRNEVTKEWKMCPITYAPLNLAGTCGIDSIVFAFLYPPTVRTPFMNKVYAKRDDSFTQFFGKFKEIFQTSLPVDGETVASPPDVPCLQDLSKDIMVTAGSSANPKVLKRAVKSVATVFEIPFFERLEDLKKDNQLPQTLKDDSLIIVRHDKNDQVYPVIGLGPGTAEKSDDPAYKPFELKSIVLSKRAPDNISEPGHAMALVSCSAFDDIDPQWHFYNGQTADVFAQGRSFNFVSSFVVNYSGFDKKDIPFGVTYQGESLNVFEKNVSAWFIYARPLNRSTSPST